jgi:hypothetical protein
MTSQKIYLKYLLFISITLIVINHHLIEANWRWDDTQILIHAINTGIWDNFTNPDVWRKFSPNNLTPWLILSFKFDYILFGLNPKGFYIHHLFSIIILTFLLIYLAIKLTSKNTSGLLIFLIFIAGAPLYTLTEQLMTRHYIEGMIFCLLSIIYSLKYSYSKNNKYLIFSLFFYALSAISKEIYVPLIGILFLIYFYKKIINYKIIISHFLIGLLYAGWRFFMLPSVIGGYSTENSINNGVNLEKYANGYLKIPELLFGNIWMLPSIAILTLTIIYFIKNPKNITFIITSLLLILLPLAPLMNYPGINNPDRYLFALWIFLSIFFVVSIFNFLDSSKSNTNKIFIIIFIFVTFPLSANQSYIYRGYAILMGKEFDDHAKFINNNENEISFFPSKLVLDSGWFITGLFDLNKNILNKENKIKIITDEIFIKDIYKDFWIYSQQCRCIENKSSELEITKNLFTKSIKLNYPLSLYLKVHRNPDSVEWIFGPYTTGSYEVLLPNSYGAIKFQKEGSLKIQIDPTKDIDIILKYTDPTGWTTYSPLLKVGVFTPILEWKR